MPNVVCPRFSALIESEKTWSVPDFLGKNMKKIVVLKFGGTSITDLGSYGVIRKIRDDFPKNKVICVLSAERGKTEKLIKDFTLKLETAVKESGGDGLSVESLYTRALAEFDLWVSGGEIASIINASITAKACGVRSIALTGWQAGIVSNHSHGSAAIASVNPDPIITALNNHDVVFVAGFQAATPDGFVTTLGRGASDLSAIAIARSLGLSDVYIYTDVDAIYTADPRKIDDDKLKVITNISFDEALELASFGGKVIHDRAVSLAQKYCTRIHIRSSSGANNQSGTVISSRYDISKKKLKSLVKGVGVREDLVVFWVSVDNTPGVTQRLIESLMKKEVRPSNVLQTFSPENSCIEFTISVSESVACRHVLDNLEVGKSILGYSYDENQCEISAIGAMFEESTGLVAYIVNLCVESDIEVQMLYANGIRVSVVVSAENFQEKLLRIYTGLMEYI